jgi:hypothetical protein
MQAQLTDRPLLTLVKCTLLLFLCLMFSRKLARHATGPVKAGVA